MRFALAGLGALLLAIMASAAAQATPGLHLPWPSGTSHRINSGNASYGCGPTHQGSNSYAIDFQFNIGEVVSAVFTGTVTDGVSIPIDARGNFLEVDDGTGYKTRYLHLRLGTPWAPGIAIGAKVAQGKHIAYSGNTGGVAAHLHFDMKLNGAAWQPEPMSGVRGFGQYGACTGVTSPYWVSRHPYDPQQVSDSTGDGKGDAVIFYQAFGEWDVARSTGSSFGPHSQWITGHGVGSNRQLLADVNLDYKTDSVVYFAGDGSWWVSSSNGSSYRPFTRWILGHGIGSSNQFLRDVNQDGKADAVVYFQEYGDWYVALSTGSAFAPYSRWRSGFGLGSTDQLLADASGDLRADAVVFYNTADPGNGAWYVAPSTGSAFGAYALWTTGHGYGSDHRFVADVNGDLKGDAAVYFGGNGGWYVALSTGSSFAAYSQWIVGHGIGSDNQMLVDATGDNKADAAVYFGGGQWYVALSTGSSFAPYALWKTGFGVGS